VWPFKYSTTRISHLVVADVAITSIRHAVQRYNELRGNAFPALFIAADCFRAGLMDEDMVGEKGNSLPRELRFDFVACMFSLHYSFESETRARGLLSNVSKRLKPGGEFVGTLPNANYLVKRARQDGRLDFGNNVYRVKFEIPNENGLSEAQLLRDHEFPPFGAKYKFFLEDAVDVPEYLVHFGTLQRLALEYDLELIYKAPFHEFYHECMQNSESVELMYRMKCLNSEGTISAEEWEAIGIYMVFVFRKKGERQHLQPRRESRPRKADEGDIIVVTPA